MKNGPRAPRVSMKEVAPVAAMILLAAGGVVAWRLLPQLSALGIDGTAQRAVAIIRSTGGWGVLLSIGLMTLHSFLPFPAEVIAIANGLIYGPVWGSIITWIGAMVGAAVAFAVVRLFGRPFVRRMLSPPQQQRLATWSRHQGAAAILLSRLVPAIAFNFVNYAAALTEVSFWTFMWATGVGILPLTIALAVLGNRMLSGKYWLGFAVAVAVVTIFFVAGRRRRNAASRDADEPPPDR